MTRQRGRGMDELVVTDKPGRKKNRQLGHRCHDCQKLGLPQEIAERIWHRLLRYRATRAFVMWPCPVREGSFHLGPSSEEP